MESKIVLLALCVGFVHCGVSYKAAVVDSSIKFDEFKAVAMIHEAAQLKVDILMLPELVSSNYGGNNKMRQALSDVARAAGIYVTAQIVENAIDQTRSNFVFDRNGTVISKPATFYRDTFLTDFGVTFDLVNEEDLLTSDAEAEGVRNVLAFGSPLPVSQFLYASQSSAAWAYTTRSNLVTARAVYGGLIQKHGKLTVTELNSEQPGTFVVQHRILPDRGEHTLEPLRGSGKQKVCHENFCCEFDVTSKSGGALPYSLLSYSGVQDVHAVPVRVETCALVACAGQHGSCFDELERNKTNVFEKVAISAYFSNSKQYPVIISSLSTYDDVIFVQRNQSNHASIELLDKEVTSLGVFGISKDLETQTAVMGDDDMSELFDYVWIRLRVAIFIVSIYVLEMM